MGPLSPPAAWPQGVLFYKSENTVSDRHSYDNSYGLAMWQPSHSSDWDVSRHSLFLFLCFDAYFPRMVLSRTSTPLTYSWLATNKIRRWNQQACYQCSHINTLHTSARPVYQRLRHTDSEQIPHRTHTHRSSKARSPTACYIHCNEITIHT